MEKPLVALLASPGADARVTSRGFLSVAHLLAPFSSHNVNIRDPSNAQQLSTKVTLDIRDIRKDGHLLTLSVLPFVLQEALLKESNTNDSISAYFDCLAKWAEPTDQETLRTYLACVFVVAGCEENPLSELSKLIQTQHTEQHSASDNTKTLCPSHCSPPRWTSPNTLKHYILLHDCARDDEAKSQEVFNQMCATYGIDSCQILKIGYGPTAEVLTDWDVEDKFNRILERGLYLALEHAKASSLPDKKETPPTVISTISPSYAMVQSPTASSPSSSINGQQLNSPSFEQRLVSQADKDECSKVLAKFLKTSLVPHVERLMKTLLEQLMDKRTIGKSLTSGVRKWFGGSSSSNNTNNTQVYTAESSEMKSRRLADLAFVFGLYSTAHSQYRVLKKEFEGDQAWLYHATALEMCALALYLSNPTLTHKQFPVYYLENCTNYLLQNNGKYTSIMRCVSNCSTIYAALAQHKEAGSICSRVSTMDNDQCVGVAQAKAAAHFVQATLERKSAFYYILAGNRLMKASVKATAIQCYRAALPQYFEKEWESIEDHLCSILCCEIPEGKMCAKRLLRGSEWQSEAKQTEFLELFFKSTAGSWEREPFLDMPIPLLDPLSITVIRGERPIEVECQSNVDIEWNDIERAAFHALAGPSSSFRSIHTVSDNFTDNTRIGESPSGERFRVSFSFNNPLICTIAIQNVRLDVEDVVFHEGAPTTDAVQSRQTINRLEIPGLETVTIELWVVPHPSVKEYRVESVKFDLVAPDGQKVLPGKIRLNVKGRRLNRNPKDMKKVIYSEDERLKTIVAKSKWPLLDIKKVGSTQPQLYAGQSVKLNLDFENIGTEDVTAISLSSDGIDCLAVSAEDDLETSLDVRSSMAVNSNSVRVFVVNHTLSPSNKMRISVQIRAPQQSRPIALLLYYRGQNGCYREWRTVVPVTSLSILDVSARILDESHGLVALNCSNQIASSDAALARVDIQRVRIVRQVVTSKGEWETRQSSVNLCPIRCKAVQLDAEQADNICFLTTGSSGIDAKNELWLSDIVKTPDWPAPWPKLSEDEIVTDYRQFAVFWKASVVANDGHVSSFTGETFVECPFHQKSLPIPGLEDIKDVLLRSPSRGVPDVQTTFNPLQVSCLPVPTIEHNFNKSKLCVFPLTIVIKNRDLSQRPANVTLTFHSKLRDPIQGLDHLPPDSRQLWWPDKSVAHAVVESGQEHSFTFKIRVGKASVYELGGNQMVLQGDFANAEPVVCSVPSHLAVVNAI